MEIIPVIDLMQGRVVRAKKGERHLYQPIESGLCRGSAPLDIVGVLLELYPFNTLYIADLDAILDCGDHHATVSAIQQRFPHLNLWLDAGLQHPEQCRSWGSLDVSLVIGSEKIHTLAQFEQIISQPTARPPILSLDFSRDGFLGPAELLTDAGNWPEKTISMTLARVGSMQGPDLELISALSSRKESSRIYTAGGIRNVEDMLQVADAGAAGVLVASALHDGKLGKEQLQRFGENCIHQT